MSALVLLALLIGTAGAGGLVGYGLGVERGES